MDKYTATTLMEALFKGDCTVVTATESCFEPDDFQDMEDLDILAEAARFYGPTQVTLANGDVVTVTAMEGSTFHDGGPIGLVLTVGNQVFLSEAQYSSWDSPEWESLVPVRRVETPVIQVTYEPIN